MINDLVYQIFEDRKVIKKDETKNYNIDDYKNPPKKNIEKDSDGNPKYRRKVVYGKDGKKHIITFAITNKQGPRGGSTVATSKWTKKDD